MDVMNEKNKRIMMKTSAKFCGEVKLADMVFLFDERDFPSEEEVNLAIDSGRAESGADPRIVTMSKEQFETVFRSLIHPDE